MAFTYQRQEGDKQYRVVSVMNEASGPWTDFVENSVEYPEQCVLEVMLDNGKTDIKYERSVRTVSVGRNGNQLFFPKDIPVARMWVRSGGMMYKVPAELKEKDGKVYVLIPGGIQNVTLCGDEYFNKVYALSIS